jgi:hypothetical protein
MPELILGCPGYTLVAEAASSVSPKSPEHCNRVYRSALEVQAEATLSKGRSKCVVQSTHGDRGAPDSHCL